MLLGKQPGVIWKQKSKTSKQAAKPKPGGRSHKKPPPPPTPSSAPCLLPGKPIGASPKELGPPILSTTPGLAQGSPSLHTRTSALPWVTRPAPLGRGGSLTLSAPPPKESKLLLPPPPQPPPIYTHTHTRVPRTCRESRPRSPAQVSSEEAPEEEQATVAPPRLPRRRPPARPPPTPASSATGRRALSITRWRASWRGARGRSSGRQCPLGKDYSSQDATGCLRRAASGVSDAWGWLGNEVPARDGGRILKSI